MIRIIENVESSESLRYEQITMDKEEASEKSERLREITISKKGYLKNKFLNKLFFSDMDSEKPSTHFLGVIWYMFFSLFFDAMKSLNKVDKSETLHGFFCKRHCHSELVFCELIANLCYEADENKKDTIQFPLVLAIVNFEKLK